MDSIRSVWILEGSEIEWPTQAGRRVLLPSEAKHWHTTHRPPPSLWSRLLQTATETTTASRETRQHSR